MHLPRCSVCGTLTKDLLLPAAVAPVALEQLAVAVVLVLVGEEVAVLFD